MKPLSVQALDKIGKNCGGSSETREAHLQHTKEFARFVEQRYALEELKNLKPVHVQAFVQYMKSQALDHGTMCNRMASVRVLAQSLGKANIVERENKAYGI